MRFILILFLSLCHGTLLFSQTFWGRTQAGANVDETLGVTGDDSGNTYTTGYFSSNASINGNSLSTSGLTDVFLSKLGPNGQSIWAVKAGGSQSDRGLGIAIDGQGNILVCGFFTGTINFGNGVSLTANANSQDAFVAKYSNAGTVIWARSGGSSGSSDRANAVAVDGQGNVSITGQFSGEASFGSFTLSGQGSTNDVFVVRYDTNGNETWAKKGSGSALDRGLAITTDNSGAVYAAGQFSGDISFDNTYPNSILNALFLIKYSAAGNEEWFRWAGGPNQSIAYGLTSNGTNVYITGDCGASITFLNGMSSDIINSGYTNGVFVAAYSGSGNYLWGTAQGSNSAVSSRGISFRNNQLALAGWHGCTFDGLSAIYGESTFNSLGFKDVWVMRYTANGQFTWGRNFGSRQDEIATSVHLTPDGFEVVTGVFTGSIYFPLAPSAGGNLLNINASAPNSGLTYCNDPAYGQFSKLDGAGSEDGFTGKLINPVRAPMDIFQRFGSGCDLDIPEACINLSGSPIVPSCPEPLIDCPPYQISGYWGMVVGSPIGFGYNVSWTPPGVGNLTINGPTNVSAVLTSSDGCYTTVVDNFADVYPEAQDPLISDNAGFNSLNPNPVPIFLCPDETVDITPTFPSSYTYEWLASAALVSQNGSVITVDTEGFYSLTVNNEFGCTQSVTVLVVLLQVPPIVDPVLVLNAPNDTLTICQGEPFPVTAVDLFTGEALDFLDFDFVWGISPSGGIGGLNPGNGGVQQSGWYTITVDIESEENICTDGIDEYSLTDSVFIVVNPAATASALITGPAASCSNDTITLLIEYDGDITYDFVVIEAFDDSLWVVGAGFYTIMVSNTNEFGCFALTTSSHSVSNVVSPIITSGSEAVICPGDSVLLFTNSPGDITWQGPNGAFANEQSTYVDDEGLYFIEVEYYPGCALVSNTIQVAEYATPFISGSGGVICPGDTLEISIISTSIDDLNWLEPLSGNDTIQYITTPGIYQAEVTSCGITTLVSIEVQLSEFELAIDLVSDEPVCAGDSIQVSATSGYTNYSWTPQASGTAPYFYQPGSVQAQAIDPNGCMLTSNVVNLNFSPIPPPPAFSFIPVCEGETQIITINSPFTVLITDGLGGSLISEGINTIEIPNFSGDTTIYAFVSSAVCSGPFNQSTVVAKLFPADPLLASDEPVCTGTNLELSVLNAEAGVVYTWLTPTGGVLTGSQVSYFVQDLSYEGFYACFADLQGCATDTVAIPVELFETRQVVLPPDTGICSRRVFIIEPDTLFQTYFWQDGSGDSIYVPTESGSYFVQVTDFNGCSSFDQIDVTIVNCDIIVPNVFTPNGDGRNDSWLVFVEEPRFFDVVIYNRWGQIVYESNDYLRFWDGVHYKSDLDCSEGVYFYIIRAVDYENMPFEATGNLTLIRD